ISSHIVNIRSGFIRIFEALVHKSSWNKLRACRTPRSDALRDRHPASGHPVEYRTGNAGFGLLSGGGPRAECGADEDLVAEHRRLDERTFAVAHRSLPATTTLLLDGLNMPV